MRLTHCYLLVLGQICLAECQALAEPSLSLDSPVGQATTTKSYIAEALMPLQTDIAPQDWVADLIQFVPEAMGKASIPGLSIALIRDGRVLWTEGFGVRSFETGDTVDSSTIFQAASLGKPVFAYAVMQLVEQGTFDLDRPLNDYLPGYLMKDDRIEQITARMVLSHTTGFPNWRGDAGLRIYFEPGLKFSYSGEGYVYLQKVVERITRQPLNLFMQGQVFGPLDMVDSSYRWQEGYRLNHAVGHDADGKAQDSRRMSQANAAYSLYTTAEDYAKFMLAVMQGRGLRETSLRQMLTPQVDLADCLNCTGSDEPPAKTSDVLSWGLGWGLQQTGDGPSIWHWGDNQIFRSYAVAFPAQGIGLVYLTNSETGLSIRDALVARALGGQHPAFSWLAYDQH